jgi:toxin-antitoxin system PIN domain toxin
VTVLLDANVLIAVTVTDHVHRDLMEDWLTQRSGPFATCPPTQGALVRLLLRAGATARDAVDVVRGLRAADAHEFWPDELSYDAVDMRGVVGHKQVTDAYLAALGRSRGGRLATLDRGLSVLHDDVPLLFGNRRSGLPNAPGSARLL